jgi:Flp pilus assembly protein TadG
MEAGQRGAREVPPAVGCGPATSRLGAVGRRSSRLGRRLVRDETGGPAAEWGLILPVLLALTLGTIEMGRLMLAYNTVAQAAMEGVRFAIVRGATSGAPASVNDIRDFVRERVSGINPADVAVTVTWNPSNYPGYPVTVQVDYDFHFLAMDFASLKLSRASTMVISQ